MSGCSCHRPDRDCKKCKEAPLTIPQKNLEIKLKNQVTLEVADKDPSCWVEGNYNKSPITIESDPQSKHVKIDTSLDTFFIDRSIYLTNKSSSVSRR